MRKLFSILAISLLSTQGLLLLCAPSFAQAPISTHQPLLIAFDGFDDETGDASDDSNTDDSAIDDGSTSGSDEPVQGEDSPDEGFRAGYSQDNE